MFIPPKAGELPILIGPAQELVETFSVVYPQPLYNRATFASGLEGCFAPNESLDLKSSTCLRAFKIRYFQKYGSRFDGSITVNSNVPNNVTYSVDTLFNGLLIDKSISLGLNTEKSGFVYIPPKVYSLDTPPKIAGSAFWLGSNILYSDKNNQVAGFTIYTTQ